MGRISLLIIIAIVGSTSALTACSPENEPAAPDTSPRASPSPSPTPSVAPTPTSELSPDPAAAGANELGAIPILMYHRVLENPSSDYDRSPAQFRAELGRLYQAGYRPVRVVDLLDGRLDLPAGTSPVVLTFDDSSPEQFGLTKNGRVRRDTAVGILLDFARTHDGFGAVASVYVNERPFASDDWKRLLRELHERGFELGNHTAGHVNLRAVPRRAAERELAAGARIITRAVPDAEVRSLSLPLGIWPEPRRIARRGPGYRHDAVLLVGANPAPSPFARDFDPFALPRIRAGKGLNTSAYWLTRLDGPGERYVSDGDPDTIAFPRRLRGRLAPRFRDRALPY